MVKESKEIPEQWDLVKIVTIYKQKGSKKRLKFYRGIFLTLVISKIFEQMVKERIEDKLSHVNLLQAGSRRERGAADNVFLLRACIDHHKFTKKSLSGMVWLRLRASVRQFVARGLHFITPKTRH